MTPSPSSAHVPEQQSVSSVHRSHEGAQPPMGWQRPATQLRLQQSALVMHTSHASAWQGCPSFGVQPWGGAHLPPMQTPEQQSCSVAQTSPSTRQAGRSAQWFVASHTPPQHCASPMHVSPAGRHGGPGGFPHLLPMQALLQQSAF
jgi:hypothetical protein